MYLVIRCALLNGKDCMDNENATVKDHLKLEEFIFYYLLKHCKINYTSNFILLRSRACQITKTVNKCFRSHGRFLTITSINSCSKTISKKKKS